MDKKLIAILACPICKGKLIYRDKDNHRELICKFDRLAYPIREEIPIMLPEEARLIPLEEVEKIK
ncbi:MAG: Trm112 family protein [Proteobacteria bacterium]|nr:Trm112 family protein [Pseudomonadota bacterium]